MTHTRHPSTTSTLLDRASEPYRAGGRFAYHFARGKMGGDPAFFRILAAGYIPTGARILDLGCGQGLIASLLDCAPALKAAGHWPPDWAPPAASFSYRGIDLMDFDIKRANIALSTLANPAAAEQGDMCSADFKQCDVTVILDVLHYVSYDAQIDVLKRVYSALSPNGVMLLRVGDAAAGWPFKMSNWVDAVVTTLRGHRLSKLYCRPLTQWLKVLNDIGFEVQALPMSEGTLFANVMLLARKPSV
jgi:2-polyprenyl-3-methyl-5-hydroxy-6-metoxy-1,4-benzoquinol methylase